MAINKNIKFKRNYNNKLGCDIFTTLQKRDDKRWQQREVYNIYVGADFVGTAQLIGAHRYLQSQVTAFVAGIDVGCTLPQANSVIDQLYGAKTDHELILLLFKWIKREKSSDIHITNLLDKIDRLSHFLGAAEDRIDELEKAKSDA